MAREISINGANFYISECINCGVAYVVPSALWIHQREHGGMHHCTNGHRQGWTLEDSELVKMRRERDKAVQQIARVEQEKREAIAAAAEQTKRAIARERRLKKRAASGTCPCCQRSFANMSAHMKTEHPDYVRATGANVVELKREKA